MFTVFLWSFNQFNNAKWKFVYYVYPVPSHQIDDRPCVYCFTAYNYLSCLRVASNFLFLVSHVYKQVLSIIDFPSSFECTCVWTSIFQRNLLINIYKCPINSSSIRCFVSCIVHSFISHSTQIVHKRVCNDFHNTLGRSQVQDLSCRQDEEYVGCE